MPLLDTLLAPQVIDLLINTVRFTDVHESYFQFNVLIFKERYYHNLITKIKNNTASKLYYLIRNKITYFYRRF